MKPKLNISELDKIEIQELAPILAKINNIDVATAEKLMDDIYQYQPFMISVIMGFHFDLLPEEHGEVIKIGMIIWEFFKDKNGIKTKKLTQKQYEKLQKRNIYLLKYLEGEPDMSEQSNITAIDLNKVKSKALLTVVWYRFIEIPTLAKMTYENRGFALIAMKSLIECLDEI
ncbi:MAG: hypothetical protein NTU44_07120 [Bacteroidetes bacterium]|nr:hypothetical protein [Bacteroidota bacterium]